MNTQVIEFLTNNPNSNKGQIADGINLRGLGLFNLLKGMVKAGEIQVEGDGHDATYSITEVKTEEAIKEDQPAEQTIQSEEVVSEVVENTKETTDEENKAGETETKEDETKGDEKQDVKATPAKATSSRDNGKFKFNGEEYGKGPLVRAVVAKYVEDHPDITYKQLKEVFPDTMMKRFGVIANETDAKKLSGSKPRYFLKPEQMIKVKGQKEPIAVCNQWTAALIEPLLKVAKELGYKIK